MPWDANGRWIPENDSTADKLTGLLASNSRYVQTARAGGVASANKRGLLNSSISAGAGEAAAIAAAAPIASQDASQTFQRNQAVLEGGILYDNQKRLNSQQNEAEMDRAHLGANTQLTIQQREAQAAERRLQMQIEGASAQQLAEFDQRTAEQLRSISAESNLLTQQQGGQLNLQRDAAMANERLQAQQNAAAKERLQLEQAGATAAQLREFDQRTAEQMRTIEAATAAAQFQHNSTASLQERAAVNDRLLQQAQDTAARERLQMEQAGATASQLREFDQRTAEQVRSLTAEKDRLQFQHNSAASLQEQAATQTRLLQQAQDTAARERLQMEQQGATAAQLREFDQRTAEQVRSIAANAASEQFQHNSAASLQSQAATQTRLLQQAQDTAARERLQMEQAGATAAQLREFDQRTEEQVRSLTAERDRLSQSQSGQMALQEAQDRAAAERIRLEQSGATAAQLREFDQRTKEQTASLTAERDRITQTQQGALTLQRDAQAGQLTLQQAQDRAAAERIRLEQAGATAAQLREFDQRTEEQVRSISANRDAAQFQHNSAASLQGQAAVNDRLLQQAQDTAARERMKLEQAGATAAQLREFDQRTKEQTAALQSNERTAMMGADTNILQTQIGANSQLSGMYLEAFSNLANNDAIPADVRNAYIAEFKRVMEQGQKLINVASNTPLNWGGGATA